MTIKVIILAAVLLGGCVQTGSPTDHTLRAALQSAATPRNRTAPRIDAHLHMMSETAMLTAPDPLRGAYVQPTLPPVVLPEELSALLQRRQAFGPTNPYKAVFTDDAIVLVEAEGRWWKGQTLISQAVSGSTLASFVPKAFAVDDMAGYISGNIRSTNLGYETHSFLLGVRKGKDGKWRIASEMKGPVSPPLYTPAIKAEKLIEVMDDAGIQYGVVHSLGFWFGNPNRNIADRHANTMKENDWTVAQTNQYPDRLIPFCGVNPLANYALSEVKRCAAMPSVRGMKIHFNNSNINPGNAEHIAKLREFFAHRMRRALRLPCIFGGPLSHSLIKSFRKHRTFLFR